MNRIRVLGDILISKIAAGEVVERPASVLKEFVENSLDAGAKKIVVELDSGGKRLVKVSDNGCGMSRDDALLSVERHATSKITDEKGLASINTFGFRGEALPSIASVSRFSLTTRPHDADVGTRIEIEGGKIRDVKDVGCSAGTTVEARSLFFNTRPRLKFLKTNETELSRSANAARAAATANPDVDFEISHNGRNLLRFPAGTLEQRVSGVLGKTELYAIGAQSGAGIEIAGFLCSPSDGLSSMTRLYCYVNGRYVRDRFLSRVVMECFGRVFDRGRYPQGAVFLTIPSEEVDVNVHPAKHEVRFRSPGDVASAMRSAIDSFLSSAPWMTGREKAVKGAVEDFLSEKDRNPGAFYKPFSRTQSGGRHSFREVPDAKPGPQTGFAGFDSEPYGASAQPETSVLPKPEVEGFFSKLNVLGQAGGLYIVCEAQGGLVIIDQHAAHERVNFERLKSSYSSAGRLAAQKLLIPEIIEMRREDAVLFPVFKETMGRIGLNAEMFGEGAVRLESLPAILNCSSGRDLFADIFAELSETGSSVLPDRIDKKTEHILATMACHKSVRAGYVLADSEIKSLLSLMDKCESPHFCPHGRPVAVNVTYGSLEKMFKRK